MEYSTAATLPAQIPWLDIHMGRQAALADGLKWIVMHESDYPDRQFARTARFLDITATPVYEGEDSESTGSTRSPRAEVCPQAAGRAAYCRPGRDGFCPPDSPHH